MVSFSNFLIDLIKKALKTDKTIIIHRLPPRKVLYVHQLGITLGLSLVILIVCLYYKPIFNLLPLYTAPILLLIFLVGTFWVSPFALFVFLYWVLFKDLPREWAALWTLSQWYLVGYVFGMILAIMYNDLIYLYLLLFCNDKVKIAFALDPSKRLNIIKSPKETEEVALFKFLGTLNYFTSNIRKAVEIEVIEQDTKKICSLVRKAYKKIPDSSVDQDKLLTLLQCPSKDKFKEKLKELKKKLVLKDETILARVENEIEPLIEKYLQTRKQKLYNYRVNTAELHPYTIVFVANPKILLQNGETIPDPIMQNRNLFLRSVEKALFSFERNEVLGRPEIWSRVRVIAIFDETLDCALVEPFHGKLQIGEVIAENLATPTDEIWDIYHNNILPDAQSTDDIPHQLLNNETDVIFAITGSKDYTRSTALFSDYRVERNPCNNNKEFEFHLDPNGSKFGDLDLPTCAEPNGLFEAEHEHYKEGIPGRVALNALDANLKSYIHEFAHAMSSYYHGRIVDEYFDNTQLVEDPTNQTEQTPDRGFVPVSVNRIERSKPPNSRVIPVHKIFARYEHTIYYSDREHPSSEENWVGYFPDRKTPYAACTMDRTYGDYRFDQLLSDFMYDRLIAKINR